MHNKALCSLGIVLNRLCAQRAHGAQYAPHIHTPHCFCVGTSPMPTFPPIPIIFLDGEPPPPRHNPVRQAPTWATMLPHRFSMVQHGA